VGEILLIAADWQFRALVRAQLLEEGYELRALPSVESALSSLVRGDEPPRLIILDMKAVNVEAGVLWDLWRLSGEAPLVLCGGALDRAMLGRENLPPARVLLRPFRVGDLVDEVRRMWA
jgi:DNA-binding response OmpR family regulator